ncbi:MAG: YdcF family protein [Rhodovibrionaceae bacterium]|nr:YdcF family protein [Rhodovibrionaceae bacterium]
MTSQLSMIVGFLVDPLNLFALIALAGVIFLLGGMRRLGTALLAVQGIVLVLVAALPVGQWLLYPLERRFPAPEEPPADLAGIVVLGGALDGDVSRARGSLELEAGAERVMAMAALARLRPDLPIIFTGPNAPLLQGDGEAEDAAIARRQQNLGLAQGRIRISPKARNTWEEAVFTRELLGEDAGGRWLLVTSAWHMPRAMGAFRQAGWEVVAYPVDYRSHKDLPFLQVPEGTRGLHDTMIGVKEWVGLASYRWLERTASLFPAPEDG